MTRVELQDATGSLSDYTRRARKSPVVVTRRGKPVALLRVLTDEDWEDYVVSTSPTFQRILKRSLRSYNKSGGIPLEDIEREFGLPPRSTKRPKATRRSR